MKKLVNKAWPSMAAPALVFVCGSMLLSACSKDPAPVAPAADAASTANTASNIAQPTGLVKDPVKHAHTADVTKWMDQASKKTPAQIAQEEKLAREAKEKQAAEAKKAQESKTVAPKTVANTIKETVTPIPAPAQASPAPVQTAAAAAPAKAPEAAPVVVAAPVVKAPEPEQNTALKLLNKVQPKYPTAAARAGIAEGSVSARLHVETDGRVSQVEILKARPTKIFDKEVIAAAGQWKYAPVSKAQTTVAEFSFKLD
ncbi:energy transducer TonB [Undibacterium rugosum]|uniref:TonB family protein n=1 Tax=Undibacterium rugosum TaxID=2762291 RepID=A0A923I0Q6_9BURK|nr:energy transducer TonB [Undibacterium rugosum]MBC3935663.1 TonB family protein [Undibacterium rugosum]MBR7778574.1 TonB family protein [Undibacterium rugosum]